MLSVSSGEFYALGLDRRALRLIVTLYDDDRIRHRARAAARRNSKR